MKTLALIRHAKSSWDDPGQKDIDRPLNARGERNAPEMGQRLATRQQKPDLLLSSPARRARETARVLAGAIGYPVNALKIEHSLYLADTQRLMKLVRGLDKGLNEVWIVGHNPDLTDFANSLSDFHTDNMPTCAICRLAFDVPRWKDITQGSGELCEFDTPKKPWRGL